jgi:catechol 2,3-dioxygenase-like lactoylglutathione lyase family enzyme
MVKGVVNLWVPVEGVERALNFYQNILGFSVIKQDGPWAEVDANGLSLRWFLMVWTGLMRLSTQRHGR